MLLMLDYDHAVSRIAARMLRSERICCKIVPGDTALETILSEDPCGLIVCASFDSELSEMFPSLLQLPIPVLALGTAAGALAVHLGGGCDAWIPDRRMADIRYDICPLFENIASSRRMISGVMPLRLPDGISVIARMTDSGLPYAFSCGERKRFGALMELEPNDPDSVSFLLNFAQRICGCTAWWDEDALVSKTVGEIRRLAGDGNALCLMTGGLHASVAALLGARALGDRMLCVFVNTGLLQEGEEEAFERFFSGRIHLRLTFRDESARFAQALKGIKDQEEKRSAVHSLMNVISREIQRQIPGLSLIIHDRTFTEQNQAETRTHRPDVSLLEPLRDLFLDEVRQVGSYLGLPYDMIAGQVIPDTGLALNIVGEVTEEKLGILRKADFIYRSILRQSAQSRKLNEYYAVLRPYERDTYSVVLRALSVNQGDDLRAARMPYDLLEEAAEAIRRECPPVKRVLYDLTPTKRL